MSRRSGREELPHPAPPLGSGDRDGQRPSLPVARRARRYLALSGSVSGASKTDTRSPRVKPLPSTNSAAGVPVLFVRFPGTMGSSDSSAACMSDARHDAFSDRPAGGWPTGAAEVSRFPRGKCRSMRRV